jgi:hypothetical protein
MTLISVDPEDLRASALEIIDAAELLEHSHRSTGNDIAVTRHAGWSTQAELETASRTWTAYLRGLHEAVEDTAAGLLAAAENYAESEWRAAASQRRGGGGRFFE